MGVVSAPCGLCFSSPACTAWVEKLAVIKNSSQVVWHPEKRKDNKKPPSAGLFRLKRVSRRCKSLSSFRTLMVLTELAPWRARRPTWLPRFRRAGPSTSLDKNCSFHTILYSIGGDDTTEGAECQTLLFHCSRARTRTGCTHVGVSLPHMGDEGQNSTYSPHILHQFSVLSCYHITI